MSALFSILASAESSELSGGDLAQIGFELLSVLSIAALALIAFLWGSQRSRAHTKALDRREQALQGIFITNSRRFNRAVPHPDTAPRLLSVEVVWGVDRFQTLVASIVHLFGGELDNVSGLTLRVRREAIVRLKERAQQQGYNALANLRIDPADIGTDPQKKNLTVAMLASATAYHRGRDLEQPD